jgi:hypothetical protein
MFYSWLSEHKKGNNMNTRLKSWATVSLIILGTWCAHSQQQAKENAQPLGPTQSSHTACDQLLWEHVYHGTFATAKDRLKPIDNCKTVTGTLHFVRHEADGDTHLRLRVDAEFKNLLNDKNADEQNMLVVESMCDRDPTQKDTVAEGVCNNWHQRVYNSSMNGQRVSVTGAYVEDEQHGWREIHPVTSIVVVK